ARTPYCNTRRTCEQSRQPRGIECIPDACALTGPREIVVKPGADGENGGLLERVRVPGEAEDERDEAEKETTAFVGCDAL
ncbi:MAG: hypothetical protein Q9194_005725, partial [Teloschistes cf. exilis]